MSIDLSKIEAAVEPILAQEAVELVDLRYLCEGGRWILRFYLDKAGGISLDDCEHLSQRIGGLLDIREELMPRSYVLEVSSPGLDRVVKKEKDFVRFAGHRARIRLKAPREGQRMFRGFLKGVEEGRVVLENAGNLVRLGLDEIEEARLDPDVRI